MPSLKMNTEDDRADAVGEGETVTAEEKKEEIEEEGEEEVEVPEESGVEEEEGEGEPAVDVDNVAGDAATTKATDDAAIDGDEEEEEGASDITAAAAAAADGEPDESTTKATTFAMTKKREKSSEGLPEGWIHRQVPRKNNDFKSDPYWFSPKLAYKFNSLLQVRRFLAVLEEAGGDEVAAMKSIRDKRKSESGGDNDEGSVPKKRGPRKSSAGDGAVAIVAATDSNDSKDGKGKSKSPAAKKRGPVDDDDENDDSDVRMIHSAAAAVAAVSGLGSGEVKKERGGGKTTLATAPKKDGGGKNGRKKKGGGDNGDDPTVVAVAPRIAYGGESGGGSFVDADVIGANRRLLDAIASRDYGSYCDLTASDLTAIEPESGGHVVQGLDFHRHYFDLMSSRREDDGRDKRNVAMPAAMIHMISPHVRWLGGGVAAVISYVRLDQVVEGGVPVTKTASETRIWEGRGGRLVHVHFHKS